MENVSSLNLCIVFALFQHHIDPAIGVYIIDRYTFYALRFLEKVQPDSALNMSSFVSANTLILLWSLRSRNKSYQNAFDG